MYVNNIVVQLKFEVDYASMRILLNNQVRSNMQSVILPPPSQMSTINKN